MKKFKSFIVKEEQVEEASKKEEGKFHSSLDKLVHKTFGKSKEEMKKEEVEQIEEMDKSQPSSSRGAEGVPTGKKAKPSKTDKVKTDALKVLQKQYKKVKEEVELDEVSKNVIKKAMYLAHDKSLEAQKSGDYNLSKNKLNQAERLQKKHNEKNKSMKEETEQIDEVAAWQRKEGKSESGGLNRKGIESYRRENPGSKLSMAVTTKPSKLKPGSKAANRRKSFCARMGGMKKRLTSAKTANDPDSRINKALRKWNC